MKLNKGFITQALGFRQYPSFIENQDLKEKQVLRLIVYLCLKGPYPKQDAEHEDQLSEYQPA